MKYGRKYSYGGKMRNIFKLVTVILLASSVVMGCAKPKVSKTLPDFASFLENNGIMGSLRMETKPG